MTKLIKPAIFARKFSFIAFGGMLGGAVSAADLTFSNAPLFLESGVQPNIYFVIDDSGSMGWEVVYTKGAQELFKYPNNGVGYPISGKGNGILHLDETFVPDIDDVDEHDWSLNWDGNDYDDLDGNARDQEETFRNSITLACRGINALHYDPAKTYTPWDGLKKPDTDGKRDPMYVDQSPNGTRTSLKVLKSPYESTAKVELLITEDDGDKTGYFPWSDGNKNGKVDLWSDLDGNDKFDVWVDHNSNGRFDVRDLNGDGIIEYWVDLNNDGIKDSNEFETETELECPDPWYMVNKLGIAKETAESYMRDWIIHVEDMSFEEMTNFGNWYSYYRSRKWVSKRALSSIITNSTARMGIDTIWNRKELPVEDVDDITYRGDTTEQIAEMDDAIDNKVSLLNTMFDIGSSNGTPLRKALKRAGEYFDTEGGAGAPILPKDDGGSCQQNFTLLFTDGVWNGDSPNVGNQDKNTTNEFDGGLFADNYQNTLADVAMKYYKSDLRDDLDDLVPPTLGVDENPAQHMVTYTVAFGVSGTLSDTMQPEDGDWPGWPQPSKNSTKTIDDVRHAAYNGRGLFLSAQDPQALIDSLNTAIADIQGRDASASAVSVNTGSISTTTLMFQAEFNSRTWTGQVNAIPLSLDGSMKFNDSNGNDVKDPDEEFVKYLASVVPDHAERVIVTHNGTSGVPFRWNSLNTSQQGLLTSADVIEYLRGDDADEQKNDGEFRDRLPLDGAEGPLGDIVNSSPAYVGNPFFLYPDNLEAKPYSAFSTNPDGDNESTIVGEKTLVRTPMIYVGSNDGMLHAFDVDPSKIGTDGFGKEVFAYVPDAVMGRLSALTKPNYAHQYTVDGTPYIGDAYINDNWSTVLVGGLNSGGQGVYAIDITDPDSFDSEANAASNVLWEFTDQDDPQLGYTFGKPVIAKANNGQWVAIFGNGYNNSEEDGTVADGVTENAGTAVLYIVDLETGNLVKKIDTLLNERTSPNGLSAPATVDYNGDYLVDAVFAGDLEGNMWKFDLSSSNPLFWDVAYESGGDGVPLFTACDSETCTTANRQSITVKPEVGRNKGATGYIVYFGTGTYMLESDNQALSRQSFYGIWDKNESGLTEFNRSHLLEQKVLQEIDDTKQEVSFRVTSKYPISWHIPNSVPTDSDSDGEVDTHLGWFIDLANQGVTPIDGKGERAVSDPVLRGDSIIFITTVPDPDPCSYGGSGWYMEVNATTGARHENAVIDRDGDGDIDEEDVIASASEGSVPVSGVSVNSLATSPVCITLANGVETCKSNTSDASILEIERSILGDVGRWMWREL